MFSKISYATLRLFRWEIKGELPDLNQYIIAVMPHTSNWDFILGLLTKWSLKIPVKYIGKHQLFRFPYGFIFRALGGYPVNRAYSNNLVEGIVEIFKREKRFVFALAPEGTRAKVKKVKTGFYHISVMAKVPILQVGFDFQKRQIILGTLFYPTGNKDADMKAFMQFYIGIPGKYPVLGIDENTSW